MFFRSVQGCGAQRSLHRDLWSSGASRRRQEPLQGQRFEDKSVFGSIFSVLWQRWKKNNSCIQPLEIHFNLVFFCFLFIYCFVRFRCSEGGWTHQWHPGSSSYSLCKSPFIFFYLYLCLIQTPNKECRFRKCTDQCFYIQSEPKCNNKAVILFLKIYFLIIVN